MQVAELVGEAEQLANAQDPELQAKLWMIFAVSQDASGLEGD